jgi:hypothetical protein
MHQTLQCKTSLSASSAERRRGGLQYVPTEEQAPDALTKPLGASAFAKFCSLLGIKAPETRTQNARQCRRSFHLIFTFVVVVFGMAMSEEKAGSGLTVIQHCGVVKA